MGQTNQFVQFPGHLQFVAGELTRRHVGYGGNIVETISKLAQPANTWALDEIAATLRKLANIFKVKIGGRRTATRVIEASGYTDYDNLILEYCGLKQGLEHWVTIEIFSIEHFDNDPTDEEIEAEYVLRSLKRPTQDHAIHFGEQYQHLPVDDYPIIFYPQDAIPFVFSLWRRGVSRGLRSCLLVPSRRWNRRCLFAGIRE